MAAMWTTCVARADSSRTQREVEHVALDEAEVRVLGEIGAGERVAVQVVEDHDLVLLDEAARERGADEARPARHEDLSSRSEARRRSLPTCDSSNTEAVIAQQLARLAKHSAIYGLGAVVSRLIGLFLLPLVTHYLTRSELGAVDTLIALSVVLVIVLRAGISMAFFRFYFDAEDEAGRITVVRTSFWFTMGVATAGLVVGWALAAQISELLFSTHSDADLVRAAFVLLWAQMNYEQLTSLFRVEERSVCVRHCHARERPDHRRRDDPARRRLGQGRDRRPRRQLHRHARGLLRAPRLPALPARARVQPAALPADAALRPAARAVGAGALGDRLRRPLHPAQAEGASRDRRSTRSACAISTAILLLLIALRTAWPAFAYSIKHDDEAKRTYAFVLTYVLYVSCWMSLTLSLLAPWIVRVLTAPAFYGGRARGAAARLRRVGVHRLQRDVDRDRPGQADAVQLGRDRRRGRS